jgi:hypothetical protein
VQEVLRKVAVVRKGAGRRGRGQHRLQDAEEEGQPQEGNGEEDEGEVAAEEEPSDTRRWAMLSAAS